MNYIRDRVKVITNFIPFASSMTFLIFLRNIFPKLYEYIETNHANKMLKSEGKFSTIIPQKFLHNSTANFEVVKSTWKNLLLTVRCPANVGTEIYKYDLPVVNPHTLETTQLYKITRQPNKHYILNFGSTS